MPHDVTPDGLHLLTGEWGALGVEEIGATVVSWRPGGRERLYTASDALVARLGELCQGRIVWERPE